MAVRIKDPETNRLARALAEATGESITEAIRTALAERLERTRAVQYAPLRASLQRIQERLATLPVLDPRAPDDKLYDEHGLWMTSCTPSAWRWSPSMQRSCAWPAMRPAVLVAGGIGRRSTMTTAFPTRWP